MWIRRLGTSVPLLSAQVEENAESVYMPHGMLMLGIVASFSLLCAVILWVIYHKFQSRSEKSVLEGGDFTVICTVDAKDSGELCELGDLELTDITTTCNSPTSVTILNSIGQPALPLVRQKKECLTSFDRVTEETASDASSDIFGSSSEDSVSRSSKQGENVREGLTEDDDGHCAKISKPKAEYERCKALYQDEATTRDPVKSQFLYFLIRCWYKAFTWNEETTKIIKLTRSLLVYEAISPAVAIAITALIAWKIGDDAVEVYLTTSIIVSLSSFVLDGLTEAEYTYTANAIGDKNFLLAARYVHIGILTQLIIGAILMPAWYLGTGYILQKVFSFEYAVAQLGSNYIKVSGFTRLIQVFYQSYGTILYSDDHEDFMMVVTALAGTFQVLLVLVAGSFIQLNLVYLGFCELLSVTLWFIFSIVYARKKLWLNPYWDGMLKCWSLSDIPETKAIISSGFILSLGTTLATVELQLFSVFAAAAGSRQLAAYLILDTISGFLEAIPNGVSEAARIRVAKNMGKKDGKQAENAAYAALRVGLLMSGIGCLVVSMFIPIIPRLFTSDQETRGIIMDALPVILYGTFANTFGCVCSYVVEGQGKFKTVTFTEIGTSMSFTLPLAASMIYVFGVGVPGLLAAISMGYLTSGSILATDLLRSKWDDLAQNFQSDDSISSSSADSDQESCLSSTSISESQKYSKSCTEPAPNKTCISLSTNSQSPSSSIRGR